jgi:rare lipoprotein A
MLKSSGKQKQKNLKLDPPMASQKLAKSLSRPVGLSFIRIALMATCMSCLNLSPLTLSVGVAQTMPSQPIQMKASYYSYASLRAEGTWKNDLERRMANGKKFNEEALTCAAGKQYKLGTYLRVRNNENGKEIVVEVTDRLAKRFYATRIDLTKGAFKILGGEQGFKKGLLSITVEELK